MVMMGRKSAILSILSIGAFVFVVPSTSSACASK